MAGVVVVLCGLCILQDIQMNRQKAVYEDYRSKIEEKVSYHNLTWTHVGMATFPCVVHPVKLRTPNKAKHGDMLALGPLLRRTW